MYVCMYVYIYIYIHIHIHTHSLRGWRTTVGSLVEVTLLEQTYRGPQIYWRNNYISTLYSKSCICTYDFLLAPIDSPV